MSTSFDAKTPVFDLGHGSIRSHHSTLKYILWPLLEYEVELRGVARVELNICQEYVLRFYAIGVVHKRDVVKHTGFEAQLVDTILNELSEMELIEKGYRITDEGSQKLAERDEREHVWSAKVYRDGVTGKLLSRFIEGHPAVIECDLSNEYNAVIVGGTPGAPRNQSVWLTRAGPKQYADTAPRIDEVTRACRQFIRAARHHPDVRLGDIEHLTSVTVLDTPARAVYGLTSVYLEKGGLDDWRCRDLFGLGNDRGLRNRIVDKIKPLHDQILGKLEKELDGDNAVEALQRSRDNARLELNRRLDHRINDVPSEVREPLVSSMIAYHRARSLGSEHLSGAEVNSIWADLQAVAEAVFLHDLDAARDRCHGDLDKAILKRGEALEQGLEVALEQARILRESERARGWVASISDNRLYGVVKYENADVRHGFAAMLLTSLVDPCSPLVPLAHAYPDVLERLCELSLRRNSKQHTPRSQIEVSDFADHMDFIVDLVRLAALDLAAGSDGAEVERGEDTPDMARELLMLRYHARRQARSRLSSLEIPGEDRGTVEDPLTHLNLHALELEARGEDAAHAAANTIRESARLCEACVDALTDRFRGRLTRRDVDPIAIEDRDANLELFVELCKSTGQRVPEDPEVLAVLGKANPRSLKMKVKDRYPKAASIRIWRLLMLAKKTREHPEICAFFMAHKDFVARVARVLATRGHGDNYELSAEHARALLEDVNRLLEATFERRTNGPGQ